jgi:hypothetical protein
MGLSMAQDAAPLIKLDTLAREIHDLCLHQNYREASSKILEGITEFRILQVSLSIMREREGG